MKAAERAYADTFDAVRGAFARLFMRLSRIGRRPTVEVIRLEPDDVLVFRSEKPLSSAAIDNIQRTATKQFPGHRVIVLDAGISLSVIRETEAA